LIIIFSGVWSKSRWALETYEGARILVNLHPLHRQLGSIWREKCAQGSDIIKFWGKSVKGFLSYDWIENKQTDRQILLFILFVDSLVRVDSLIFWFVDSLIRWFVGSCWFVDWFLYLVTSWLIDWLLLKGSWITTRGYAGGDQIKVQRIIKTMASRQGTI